MKNLIPYGLKILEIINRTLETKEYNMSQRINTKKKQLEMFARQKFQQYVMDDWRIEFGNKYSPRSYAHCSPAIKVIFIEEWTVNEFKIATLKDVFLHELAHAMLGDINYVQGFPKHGKLFRDICKKIGCKGYGAKGNLYIFDIYGKSKVSREEEYAAFKLSPEYKKIIAKHKTV